MSSYWIINFLTLFFLLEYAEIKYKLDAKPFTEIKYLPYLQPGILAQDSPCNGHLVLFSAAPSNSSLKSILKTHGPRFLGSDSW